MSLSLLDEKGNPTVIKVQAVALAGGLRITTAIFEISFRRISDDQFFDGTFTAGVANFIVTETFLPMTKVGDLIAAGFFFFNFDTNGLSPDTYIGNIIDTSDSGGGIPFAENIPQFTDDLVGDGIAHQVDLAASAAIGKATYSDITSVESLKGWNDPTRPVGDFDMKDKDGNPAQDNNFFEKIPQ